MKRDFAAPRMERLAKALILCGFALAGVTTVWPQLAFRLGGYTLLRALALFPGLTLMLLAVATAISLLGTTALLRRPPPMSSRISGNDVAHLVLGLVVSSAGVCVLGTLLVQYMAKA